MWRRTLAPCGTVHGLACIHPSVHLATPLPCLQLASIAQHGLPIVHLSFLPGRGTSTALSVDRRGRLALHTLTASALPGMAGLMRPSVSSRVLLDGTMGQVGG